MNAITYRRTAKALLGPIARNLVAGAMLVALATWPHPAPAQTATAAAATSTRAVAATPAQKQPEWIEFDDATYTPVVDDVSAQLALARAALNENDTAKASASLKTAAQALQAQADRVGQLERRRAAADMKVARETHSRIALLAKRLGAAAEQVQAGKLVTTAQLDKTIDKAARADLDRRWLVSDITTWYPVVEDPQRHLQSAAEMMAKKDYKAAVAEIRKASAYVRLEAGRATGEAKWGLESAQAALERTAREVDRGRAVSEKSVGHVFAQAEQALAVAHRAKAAEAWSRKAYDRAGYELKAAAHGLDSAAAWAGGKTQAAVAATGADTRALGDKLASGGVWARDEVGHGFASLGHALNRVGQAIGVKDNKATPFDTGT